MRERIARMFDKPEPLSDADLRQFVPQDGRIKFYAHQWCGASRRCRAEMDARGVEYDYIDIEQDADAEALVKRINRGYRSVPTIIFPDGDVLVEPSAASLDQKLDGLQPRRERPAMRPGEGL